jgi:RNA polymerase sigma-70 factor (ECF subfamily)
VAAVDISDEALIAQGQLEDLVIDELPDLYRTVVHLHYWMGGTVEEIAAMLGAPGGTVKSYLHRARRRLAESLRGRGIRNV